MRNKKEFKTSQVIFTNKELKEESKILKKIWKAVEEWKDFYAKNNQKAIDNKKFYVGEQWDIAIKAAREKNKKQCVVFNETQKLIDLRRVEVAALQLGVDVICHKNSYEGEKQKNEEKIVKKALEYFLLPEQYINHYTECFFEHDISGFSNLYIYIDDKEAENTQNRIKLYNLSHYSCFYDSKAQNAYKEDGRYCGFLEDEGKVINFWYKAKQKVKYYLIQDNINEIREDQYIGKKDNIKEVNEKEIEVVKYIKATKDSILIHSDYPKKGEYLTKLPIVFFGEVIKIPNQDCSFYEETTCILDDLKEIQQAYNYVNSQLVTNCIGISGDKWLATPSQTDVAKKQWDNINNIEGTVYYNDSGNIDGSKSNPPTYIPSKGIDVSLMQYAEITKKALYELGNAGHLLSDKNQGQNPRSGAAIAESVMQSNMLNNVSIEKFKKFINYTGSVIKELLPFQIMNEQEIIVGKEKIHLNKKSATYTEEDPQISNNIKVFLNNYNINIVASVSDKIEKIRNREYLLSLIRLNPSLGEVFADQLFDPEKQKALYDRARLLVPEQFLNISDGNKTEQEIRQEEEQKKQGEQQMSVADQAIMQEVQQKAAKDQGELKLKSEKLDQEYQNMILDKLQKAQEQKNLLTVKIAQIESDDEVENRSWVIRELQKRDKEMQQEIEFFKGILIKLSQKQQQLEQAQQAPIAMQQPKIGK